MVSKKDWRARSRWFKPGPLHNQQALKGIKADSVKFELRVYLLCATGNGQCAELPLYNINLPLQMIHINNRYVSLFFNKPILE